MNSLYLLHKYLLTLLFVVPFSWAGIAIAEPAHREDRSAVGTSAVESNPFTPAVLRISFTSKINQPDDEQTSDSFVDLTLIPHEGDIVGRRISLSGKNFIGLLRLLYQQLAKQEPMNPGDINSPSRQLYRILIEPIEEDLTLHNVTTLLIAADSGLQAIPYAALHDGQSYFGLRYSLAITPSLALMPLYEEIISQKATKMVAMGASKFENLAPLPLVPQELKRVSSRGSSEVYLDRAFTQQQLIEKAVETDVTHVHLATHAEFLPGGPEKSRLYSGQGPMNLSGLSAMRQRREDSFLDLFVLSACRTALGDKGSELGFSGLALQAGSRSAIGTLWYIDDVATSAFFVLFYSHLDSGLPKAQAIQATRRNFSQNNLRLKDNTLVTTSGTVILENLNAQQQRRIADGLHHPFFWAGIELLGIPL
jgi:CHAT domain-containing protein